jgi:hypothetical protein
METGRYQIAALLRERFPIQIAIQISARVDLRMENSVKKKIYFRSVSQEEWEQAERKLAGYSKPAYTSRSYPIIETTAFCPDDPSFYYCCSDDPKICVCPNNPRKKRIGLVECDFHSRANGSTAQIPSYLATIHLTMYNALCNTPGLVPRSVSEATPPDLGALSLGQQF